MGAMIEEMLEVERDVYIGYQKYQRSETMNSRNSYSPKNVHSTQCDIKLDIPRDREGQFKTEFINKHKNDISQIEDKIISMYAKVK